MVGAALMTHTLRWILALLCALLPAGLHAQLTHEQEELLLLEGTPIGALPPIALPMPASRNHNYWGLRLQAGDRESSSESHLPAFAAGLDFQYRGGSIIGITGGYQKRDCGLIGPSCGGHALFGVRTRINLITGGNAIASVFHDYTSTTTVGGEMGLGYAPNVVSGKDACTLDFGVPITISLGQRIRIATFLTPGIMWDLNCTGPESPSRAAWLSGIGFGLQQLGNRGLDVYVGLQKIFRRQSGYQLGVSVTFVRLP
jgi:hypothetical protein